MAVGHHTRLPRRYRGADVLWWLDRAGVFDDRASAVHDLDHTRRQPSMQLTGSPPPHDLDLATLQRQGVRLAGHLVGVDGTTIRFADDLHDTIHDADTVLARVLARVDDVADSIGTPEADSRPAPIPVPAAPSSLDVRAERISAVVWATGFSRSYPWLHLPVLDGRGDIVQIEGITPVRGLYTIGMRFQRVRRSSFIDGVGADARLLAHQIATTSRVCAAA